MSVPFTQMATEALYYHSKEMADLISSQISIVGVLGARNRIKIITGGLGWRERVFYGTSVNAGHRSPRAAVPTEYGENMTMAQYDPAFYSDAVVVNKVEVAQAKGEHALGDLLEDSWTVSKTYAATKIATDLWASSQANSNYPIPLRVFIPDTATASQTGTNRGGIDSSDNSWWRSQYYGDAMADLGATAGLRILQQNVNKCSRSSAKVSKPDFALTTSALFSRIASTMDTNRRYIKDEKIAKLGFEHLEYLGMSILWDSLCPAKHFYILNTRKLNIKCLKMPHMQNINVNENQYSLPMVIEPMRDDLDTFSYISLLGLSYQVTCNDVAGLGVLANCTE